jgi:hypothetical protein
VLVLGLVPAAWRMNKRAPEGLFVINLCVGVVNLYRFWPLRDRPSGILLVLPFAVAWSLWSVRRNLSRATE